MFLEKIILRNQILISDLTNDLNDIIDNHFDAYCEKVLKMKNMELNNE